MTKTITIRDEVYEKLRMLNGDAPLSDLIVSFFVGLVGLFLTALLFSSCLC